MAIALAFMAAFSSCTNDDDEETASNTMLLRGTTYKIVHVQCGVSDDFVNVDVDTEEGVLHGHGGFPASYIGKTTDLEKNFFLSFNPQSGSSIDPVIKSGTVKVTKSGKIIHVVVDATEDSGQKFTMNFEAEDLGQNF